MRPESKVWRKNGRHTARRQEFPIRNPKEMTDEEILAEAAAILARQRYLERPDASNLAFSLVMAGVPIESIELAPECGIGACDNPAMPGSAFCHQCEGDMTELYVARERPEITKLPDYWTEQLLIAGRDWLEDIGLDVPVDATDAEVRHNINRWYSGGWEAFVSDHS